MKKVVIPGTDFKCSKFIFGTASLFHTGFRKRREYILEEAINCGFTHFDTAPYYGFGMAERDLSRVLKRYPEVTVTSKVGLYSPGGEDQNSINVFLRKATGRIVKGLTRPEVDFEVKRAIKQLDASLSRLGRDHIDLFMLHEPDYTIVKTDEWADWLTKEVKDGRVGLFGLALNADRLRPFLVCENGLTKIIQTTDSLQNKDADIMDQFNKKKQITYGYLSSTQTKLNSKVVQDVLKNACQRNQHGAIIVSSSNVKHIRQYASLADETL